MMRVWRFTFLLNHGDFRNYPIQSAHVLITHSIKATRCFKKTSPDGCERDKNICTESCSFTILTKSSEGQAVAALARFNAFTYIKSLHVSEDDSFSAQFKLGSSLSRQQCSVHRNVCNQLANGNGLSTSPQCCLPKQNTHSRSNANSQTRTHTHLIMAQSFSYSQSCLS